MNSTQNKNSQNVLKKNQLLRKCSPLQDVCKQFSNCGSKRHIFEIKLVKSKKQNILKPIMLCVENRSLLCQGHRLTAYFAILNVYFQLLFSSQNIETPLRLKKQQKETTHHKSAHYERHVAFFFVHGLHRSSRKRSAPYVTHIAIFWVIWLSLCFCLFLLSIRQFEMKQRKSIYMSCLMNIVYFYYLHYSFE